MKTEYVVVAEQAPPLGQAYSIIPNDFYPAAYKLSTCFDHHSILYRIWTINLSGLPLGRVVMRSIRSMVERRFESYSGSLFLAMKTEYVVVVEQAPPLGPAYSIIPHSHHTGRKKMLWGYSNRVHTFSI